MLALDEARNSNDTQAIFSHLEIFWEEVGNDFGELPREIERRLALAEEYLRNTGVRNKGEWKQYKQMVREKLKESR